MKLLTSSSIAALATLFSVSAASASDLLDGRLDASSDQPTQAQVNWSGLWVGAVGGMNFFNTETTFTDENYVNGELKSDWTDTANIDGLGAEGLFGEAQIGFDKQVSNRVVIGVFGGVNISDAEFSASYTENGTTLVSVNTDYEWGSVLGARLGFLKSDSTLFYAAGGWAHAQLGDTVVNGAKFNTGGDELDGWFGEIGMETQVTGNVFLTVSGRYTDYGSETLWSDGEIAAAGFSDVHTIDTDTDSLAVMVGLKAKLGGF